VMDHVLEPELVVRGSTTAPEETADAL
jgi:hypothetical protein